MIDYIFLLKIKFRLELFNKLNLRAINRLRINFQLRGREYFIKFLILVES
jgi:hypothetical protein